MIGRRSFLKLLGSTAIVAGIPVAESSPPSAPFPQPENSQRKSGLRLSDRARDDQLDALLQHSYLRFTDRSGKGVGDVFRIPADWWSVSRGVATMKEMELHWSGPPAMLFGIELYRDQECREPLLRASIWAEGMALGVGDCGRLNMWMESPL